MIFGLGSTVIGPSGKLGEIDRIMFDPNTQRVEHLVVKHGLLTLRVVPFHEIARVDADGVHLRIDEEEFGHMPDFNSDLDRARDPDYIAPPAEETDGRSGLGFQMDTLTARGAMGYASDKPMGYPGYEQKMPDDKQLPAIGRGTDVFEAGGEKVGEVGDLSVESDTGMAARIVVRRGLILKNNVEIPLDWLDAWTPRGVGLTVPKSDIEALAETRAA
jgi:sporulation protein YlmC with PRC-barrel domain